MAKEKKMSFFLYYLYRALKAVNRIENFKYRIIQNDVYEYEQVNASPTINRKDGTFGFAYMNYFDEEAEFYRNALKEIEKVQNSNSLLPALTGENVIHFSAIPWINFTSLSHARSYSQADSCPKISFGKITEVNGVKTMPTSIHVHHALMDGFHVGKFIEEFQGLLNE
tara:strand:- start:266 stop:769 length:504 start_codon:yes stop_codon:yes gene_type:complete